MRRFLAVAAAGTLLVATAGTASATPTPPPFGGLRAQAEAAVAANAPRPAPTPGSESTGNPYEGLPSPCVAAMLDIAAGGEVAVPANCAPACKEAGALLRSRFSTALDRSPVSTGTQQSETSRLSQDDWERLEPWQQAAVKTARPELVQRLDDARHAAERLPEVQAACR